LYEVDKDNNGELKKAAIDENGQFTIVLGGGEANLYFWKLDAKATSTPASDEGMYASFALDNHNETYWRPSAEAKTYSLENSFDESRFDEITNLDEWKVIPATGHHFEDGVCTGCGAVLGDINNSGSLEVADVTAIQRYIVGSLTEGPEFDKLLADVNNDGTISIIDATLIQISISKK